MKILVYRPDGNRGPYSPYDIQSLLKEGLLKPDDIGWHEGLTDWQPITTFLPATPNAPSTVDLPPLQIFPATAAYSKPAKRSPTQARDEDTRRHYLNHEASIRSVGLLYYIGSFAWLVVFIAAYLGKLNSSEVGHGILLPLAPALCVLLFYLGWGMRKLDPNIVLPVTIMASIGLIGFPIGTALNAYILYLLYSEKGKTVFSHEYHETVAATPNIRYHISLIVWVGLALVVFVFGSVIYAGLRGE